jgi:hypothetical protein
MPRTVQGKQRLSMDLGQYDASDRVREFGTNMGVVLSLLF